jgi:hypothetical protein
MMQTLPKGLLIYGLLLLTGQTATAQKPSPPCPPAENAINTIMAASVTGCPFSAVLEITQTQTLADGTHIQRKSKMLIYRDSLGRIRYDHYLLVPADKEIPSSPASFRYSIPSLDSATFSIRPLGLSLAPARLSRQLQRRPRSLRPKMRPSKPTSRNSPAPRKNWELN